MFFLVERSVEGQKTKRITCFFLLKKEEKISMTDFMKEHNISDDKLKDHMDEIMDYYNDMIKFQNDKKVHLHYLTIFSQSNDIVSKLVNFEENDNSFIKWITVDDKIWLDKIYKYFLTKSWFENSDNLI